MPGRAQSRRGECVKCCFNDSCDNAGPMAGPTRPGAESADAENVPDSFTGIRRGGERVARGILRARAIVDRTAAGRGGEWTTGSSRRGGAQECSVRPLAGASCC